VHAAQLSSPWFSSLFAKPAATIQVSAPSSVTSGTAFDVTWKYSTADKGFYTFLYACQGDVQFKTEAAGGNGMINVPCGAAFSVPPNSNAISLTPTFDGTSPVKVSLSIIFIPTAGSHVQGSTTVTVNPASVTVTTTKPTTSQATPVKTTKPVPAGLADLRVTIISIGIIDPSTGSFVNRAPQSPDEMAAVEFDIANIGGSSTCVWYFEANLPTQSGYVYSSPAQASLAPGDHILNTLRFTDIAQSGGIVSIQIDPSNMIRESAKGNNYASQAIGMSGYYRQPYSY